MKVGPAVCVIILVVLVMCFFISSSSNMNSYYEPSSCSCNKPQRQGVYVPDMNAFPSSSKQNKTYLF